MPYSALILSLLVLASCESACSSPKAPDFNKIPNAQELNFVGEWRTSDNHFFTLDEDGTGVYGSVLSADAGVVPNTFSWRTTKNWFVRLYPNGSQTGFQYRFSDNYQTIVFRESRQTTGAIVGTNPWTKVGVLYGKDD